VVNYLPQISPAPFRNLEVLLTNIFIYLLNFFKNEQILNGIPLSVNIFITKATFLSLISNLDETIKRAINKNINFLDIIQMNNFKLKLYKLSNISQPKAIDKYEYQEFMKNLDTNIQIPNIPNSIIFNFIITVDETTKSQENKEDSLEYSEYQKIISIDEGIQKLMTKYIAIHIPFSSYHIRDMLIASLFSKIIYGNQEQLLAMWVHAPAKLFKDSNLDKVFMYSLLHNTITKKQQLMPKQSYPSKECFLSEFLRHMNMKPESKDNKSMISTIEDKILNKIHMKSEFMQTDYSNLNYNIFEACGIDLRLYELIIRQLLDTQNTVEEGHNLEATTLTNSGNITSGFEPFKPTQVPVSTGGFNRKKNRTKNYIKNNKKSKNIKGNKITTKYSQIKRYKYKKTSKM
jgi:hypothetical protein